MSSIFISSSIIHYTVLRGLHVRHGPHVHFSVSVFKSALAAPIKKRISMNIMKGEGEWSDVTYFYHHADNTSFIQAGGDPQVLGLNTLHVSRSIFNCLPFLRECLFNVHGSICSGARQRSPTFLQRRRCHVQWKETTWIKHIIWAFMKQFSANWTSLSTSRRPSLNNVCIMFAVGRRRRRAEGFDTNGKR